MYFKSSVTAVPPFGEDFRLRLLAKSPFRSSPMTEAASAASFSRIWRGVRVEVGMSKYSSCFLKSYGAREHSGSSEVGGDAPTARENDQNFSGATRAT